MAAHGKQVFTFFCIPSSQAGLIATSALCYLIGFIVNEGLPAISKVLIVWPGALDTFSCAMEFDILEVHSGESYPHCLTCSCSVFVLHLSEVYRVWLCSYDIHHHICLYFSMSSPLSSTLRRSVSDSFKFVCRCAAIERIRLVWLYSSGDGCLRASV